MVQSPCCYKEKKLSSKGERFPFHAESHFLPKARFVQIIPGEPVFGVWRDFCDESWISLGVRKVWDAIPEEDRQKLRCHLRTPEPDVSRASMHRGPLRIDALPNWPEVYGKRWLAVCMNGGHAIRIKADVVTRMQDRLDHLIAHELAHVYQYANDEDTTEDGARRIALRWGFRDLQYDDLKRSHHLWVEAMENVLKHEEAVAKRDLHQPTKQQRRKTKPHKGNQRKTELKSRFRQKKK